MDVKEDHQQQTTMKKKEKYNQYHHIHKVQHFKKKKKKQKRCYGSHKQSRTISDNNQLPLGDLVQIPDFQQLSISSQQSSSTEEEEKKKKYNQKTTVSNHLDIASNTDPTLLLPDYCMMDDIKLKEMLLMTSTLEQDFNTVAFGNLLDNEDIFVCIRQLAQRINRFNYTKLQYEQWTYYYDLGMKESIWHGRVPKKMADANSMCYTYGRSRMLIQQRQQKYKRQLEQIQNETNTHMERAKAIVSSNSLDLVKLMNIINQLIDKDQYQLRVELQRRRILLQFDAKEHQLVNEFYQMKPRPSEVSTYLLFVNRKISWNGLLTYVSRFIQHESYGKLFMVNKHCNMKLLYLKNGYRLKVYKVHVV